ncbi:MAG TPA: enoyl-CoA hydratase/isomerase family protein [Kofleriaceae bacterium]|nr:enoyl-CoA hydratase/isomerase family protein [Kofleriaceae bacterium]
MPDAGDAVTYRREGAVGVIAMNRPDNRNSMTAELLDAFAAASAAARADREARAVVVVGSGSCFSAGADFKAQVQRAAGGTLPHERSYAMYEPFLSVLDIEVPVIAAMNGHAVGGGFGLALLCDIRIACREAKIGANFARLGLGPGLGISYVLPRLIGASRAAELLYTGRLVSGEEAAALGLASRALAASEVLPAALELAREIAAAAPLAVRATRRGLVDGLGWDVRRAAWREAFAQAATVTTEDFQEGVAALLEKREPRFSGK